MTSFSVSPHRYLLLALLGLIFTLPLPALAQKHGPAPSLDAVQAFVAAQPGPVSAYGLQAHFSAPDITLGAEYIFDNNSAAHNAVAALDATHFVIAYQGGLGGTAIIGEIAGSTITYGTANNFNAGSNGAFSVAALDATHFVVAYEDIGNDYRGTAIVGEVAGTTITYGTKNIFNASGPTEDIDVAALDDTHFVVAYQNGLLKGTAIIGEVAGTSITFGTENIHDPDASNTAVSALDATHFVIAYPRFPGLGTAVVGEVSGTTITYGTATDFNAADTDLISVAALDDTHFVVAYQDVGNSDFGTAIVGIVSGTTITFGAEGIFNADVTCCEVSVAALTDTQFLVAYAGNPFITTISGKVAGTTLTAFGTETTFDSDPPNQGVAAAALNTTDFVLAYAVPDDGFSAARIGTTYSPEADLSLTKSVDDADPDVGDTVQFTLTLTNDGPREAPNVEVTDVIPVGFTYVSDDGGSQGSTAEAGGTVTWTVGTLAVGTATLVIDATVNGRTGATDEYKNTAQVTASDVPDPNSTPANDDGDQSEDDEASATINIPPLDYGDAPAPYPTLFNDDGARHAGLGPFLGTLRDLEADGLPSPDAGDDGTTGDDGDGTDDEDGVAFLTTLVATSTSATTASVEVIASAPGFVNAWMTFDGDGNWIDLGEQILTDAPVVAGANVLSFTVPAGATPGTSFARFRLDTTGGLSYDGLAPDGEVEDYVVSLVDGDTPGPIGLGAPATGGTLTLALDLGAAPPELVFSDASGEVARFPATAASSLTINGSDDDDTLEIDFTNIDFTALVPLPPGGLTFNGGGQTTGDALTLLGPPAFGQPSVITHTFVNENDGAIDIDSGLIAYTGLEPIIDNLSPTDRVFTFTGGAETITLSDDGDVGDGESFIDSSLGESVTFTNPTASLTVNAGTGDDAVTMLAMDSGFAVPVTLNGDGGSDSFAVTPSAAFAIAVNGGAPGFPTLPGDVLDIDPDAAGQTVTLTGPGAGAWSFTTEMPVTFAEIESLADAPGPSDLAITKSVDFTTAYPGDVLTFTITLTNDGPDPVLFAEVTDVLDARFECACMDAVDRGTFSHDGSPMGGTATWTDLYFNTGETATLTFKVAAIPPPGPLATVDNTAAITFSALPDPDGTDDAATVTLTLIPPIRFPANYVVQSTDVFVDALGRANPLLGTYQFGMYRGIPKGVVIGDRVVEINDGLTIPLIVTDLLVLDLDIDGTDDVILMTSWGQGGIYRSLDMGRTWTPVTLPLDTDGVSTDGIIYAIERSPVDGTLYVSADRGRIFRSVDDGVTWTLAGLLPGASADTPWSLVAHPSIAGHLIAGTQGKGVFRSLDGGTTWTPVAATGLGADGSAYVFDLEYDPAAPSALWAATATGVFVTTDAGATWTAMNDGLSPFREARALAFDPSATGPVFVALWGGGVKQLPNRSVDTTWEQYALRGAQITALTFDPVADVFVAGESGGGVHVLTGEEALATSVEEPAAAAEIPSAYSLGQNYPNPFNPVTTITFGLPEASVVRVSVYDVLGREVAVLVSGKLSAGQHAVRFEAGDLPSGVYLYRLEAAGQTLTRSLVLMK